MRALPVIALLFVAAAARGDDRLQLGATFLVASETTSAESAGHPGVAFTAAAWHLPLGVAIEVGRHGWSWDTHVRWARASARIALATAHACDRERPTICVQFRPWIDLGLAREHWVLEEPGLARAPRWRQSTHAGIGIDMMLTRSFGFTVFLRGQRGDAVAIPMTRYGEVEGPYAANMAFGTSLVFAGP